ncbi:hypothetical protein ACTOB_008580 [Actinoplanes oblitus]|uniref:Band 7 domain-containing protein n=1 Tax=Actinoplanes oblitus TaxID=3040509 RepID=A0ABY8WIQ7_9ACTN|nr:hypothetical protein [Actinoplanes oblitus]WIM96388.1 hypothetical protein ACTOB_008580 [Actinoplanes oblitus]
MSAYPLVRSVSLNDAQKGGLFGLGKKRRVAADLPKADPHEVWVYRVEGRHVVNRGELALDDDDVVRADSVSLVNVGRDVPVTVELRLPSAEASDFTVRVTFACTVTDAARVVREDIKAAPAVLAYLRRDSKLGHLALNYRMSDLNALRRDATARIRAYTEVKAPEINGLDVRFVGIEVLTPQELGAFEQKRREAEASYLLQRQQAGHHHSAEIEDEIHAQGMAGRRRGARYVTEQEDQEHGISQQHREQRARHRMTAEDLDFVRHQADLTYQSVGSDPIRASLLAEAKGQGDMRGFAESQAAADRDRVEYQRKQFALDRDDDRQAIEWARQQRAQQEAADRAERLEDKREDRKDARDQRREQREDDQKKLELQLDVLRELAKHGHLDMINVQVDKLVADISGGTVSAVATVNYDELPPSTPATSLRAAGEDTDTDTDQDDAAVHLPNLDNTEGDDDDGR